MLTARRDEPASQMKICACKSQLEGTMPSWSSEQNLNYEDHVFLESMKTDRQACIGSRHRISKQTSKRKEKWMEEQEQRAQRKEIRKMLILKLRSHKVITEFRKLDTSIFISHDVLKSPGVILFLVWTATRAGDFKTSPGISFLEHNFYGICNQWNSRCLWWKNF